MKFWDTIKNRYSYLNQEIGLHIFFLAIITGILGGIASLIFEKLLEWIFFVAFELPMQLLGSHGLANLQWIPFLISPIIGGLIVGFILHRTSKNQEGYGIPSVIEAYHYQNGKIPDKVVPLALITAAVTLSTGGSAGRQGLIAQVGGSIGSILATKLKLHDKDRKTLLLSGLAAGISATFNAPIGAALFAIEVIRPRELLRSFPMVLLSSVTGYITRLMVISTEIVLDTVVVFQFVELRLIPLYILLGIVTGITSGLWIKIFHKIKRVFKKFFEKRRIPPLLQPIIGRTIVGVMLCILFLILEDLWLQYTIMGFTLNPIKYLLDGTSLTDPLGQVLLILSIVVIFKIVATPLTLVSGGSGGIFAPTLFIGAFIGGIFGKICFYFFNLSEADMLLFALIGMAGMLAGTCRAPLTAILMTTEMSGNYFIIIPLVLTTIIGYIISFFIEPEDIFSMELKQRGIKLNFFRVETLKETRIEELMIQAQYIQKLKINDPVKRANKRVLYSFQGGVPVYDAGKMVGIVTSRDIIYYMNEYGRAGTVGDVLNHKPSKEIIGLTPENNLADAMNVLYKEKISNLPIFKKDKKGEVQLVGWLNKKLIDNTLKAGIEQDHLFQMENIEVGKVSLENDPKNVRKKEILLMEQDPVLAKIHEKFIKRLDMTPIVTSSLEKGLSKFMEHPNDFIAVFIEKSMASEPLSEFVSKLKNQNPSLSCFLVIEESTTEFSDTETTIFDDYFLKNDSFIEVKKKITGIVPENDTEEY